MSMSVQSVKCFAPKPRKIPPYVLDESIPRSKPPQEVIRDIRAKKMEKMLEKAKNKPAEERTNYENFLVLQNKLKKIFTPVVLY